MDHSGQKKVHSFFCTHNFNKFTNVLEHLAQIILILQITKTGSKFTPILVYGITKYC